MLRIPAHGGWSGREGAPYPARQDGAQEAFIVDQLLQILGAVLVLAAYAAAQLRLLDARSFVYGLLNLAGSAILVLLALDSRQWGFLLLEGTWAVISLWAVLALLRRSRARSRGPRSA